jgi:hypothetical protein
MDDHHLPDEECLVDHEILDHDDILEHHDDVHVSDEEDEDIEERDIELQTHYATTITTTTQVLPLRGSRHPDHLPSDLLPEPETP